jgi:sugar phosphate isomerase/epimerase
MKRRHFVQTLTLGAAALQFNWLFAGGANNKNQLGVQLYTIRDAVAKDLEGSLEKLAGLGYKNLEIYGYNGTFFGKTAIEFKAILDKAGLQVISSHHGAGIANQSQGTMAMGWEKAVEDIHHLGAKYMACAYLAPNERTTEIYKSLPGLLSKAGEQTKAAGIQFAYHNHDFEFEKYEDMLAYDHILKNTSADLVQMELDLYWINRAGHDPVAYFEKYPGRFPLWHVKDMEANTKDITQVGSGTIDFDKIFAAKKLAGMEYWFVEQDVSKMDIFESLKMSRDYVNKKGYL